MVCNFVAEASRSPKDPEATKAALKFTALPCLPDPDSPKGQNPQESMAFFDRNTIQAFNIVDEYLRLLTQCDEFARERIIQICEYANTSNTENAKILSSIIGDVCKPYFTARGDLQLPPLAAKELWPAIINEKCKKFSPKFSFGSILKTDSERQAEWNAVLQQIKNMKAKATEAKNLLESKGFFIDFGPDKSCTMAWDPSLIALSQNVVQIHSTDENYWSGLSLHLRTMPEFEGRVVVTCAHAIFRNAIEMVKLRIANLGSVGPLATVKHFRRDAECNVFLSEQNGKWEMEDQVVNQIIVTPEFFEGQKERSVLVKDIYILTTETGECYDLCVLVLEEPMMIEDQERNRTILSGYPLENLVPDENFEIEQWAKDCDGDEDSLLISNSECRCHMRRSDDRPIIVIGYGLKGMSENAYNFSQKWQLWVKGIKKQNASVLRKYSGFAAFQSRQDVMTRVKRTSILKALDSQSEDCRTSLMGCNCHGAFEQKALIWGIIKTFIEEEPGSFEEILQLLTERFEELAHVENSQFAVETDRLKETVMMQFGEKRLIPILQKIANAQDDIFESLQQLLLQKLLAKGNAIDYCLNRVRVCQERAGQFKALFSYHLGGGWSGGPLISCLEENEKVTCWGILGGPKWTLGTSKFIEVVAALQLQSEQQPNFRERHPQPLPDEIAALIAEMNALQINPPQNQDTQRD
ncbi:MAG: hypothetical protein LBS71_01830 [Puniceicoccales bacterium]|nr:hypothetical protein [Puniceicoccales bacterium]